MKRVFVTGIGTGIGKTIVCAILCEALGADYWKPIQAGSLEVSDSDVVRSLVTDPQVTVHAEGWRLRNALSPHAAAGRDGVHITLDSLQPPTTDRPLIIEGAGGLLVPLNSSDLLIDAVPLWQAEIVVVSQHYLGSINHSLLTLAELRRRQLNVTGIIFNGTANPDTEDAILGRTTVRCLGRLGEEESFDAATVQKYAQRWKLP